MDDSFISRSKAVCTSAETQDFYTVDIENHNIKNDDSLLESDELYKLSQRSLEIIEKRPPGEDYYSELIPYIKIICENIKEQEKAKRKLFQDFKKTLNLFINNKNGTVTIEEISPLVHLICKDIDGLNSKFELAKIFESLSSNNNFDNTIVSISNETNSVNQVEFYPLEFWEDREKSNNENPIQFISRVYSTVLDGYFTTADLKRSDKKLHRALYNWVNKPDNKKPSREELNLPTKKELNDWLLKNSDSGKLSQSIHLNSNIKDPKLLAEAKIAAVARTRARRGQLERTLPS